MYLFFRVLYTHCLEPVRNLELRSSMDAKDDEKLKLGRK